jgi:hypothetical protein
MASSTQNKIFPINNLAQTGSEYTNETFGYISYTKMLLDCWVQGKSNAVSNQGMFKVNLMEYKSWLRLYATSRKVAGSTTDGVIDFFQCA